MNTHIHHYSYELHYKAHTHIGVETHLISKNSTPHTHIHNEDLQNRTIFLGFSLSLELCVIEASKIFGFLFGLKKKYATR